MGWSRLGSSDAGPGAPPSLSHLARALASGLLALAYRLFGVLAIMHAIWDAGRACRHLGTGRHVDQRQSDCSRRVKGAKLL